MQELPEDEEDTPCHENQVLQSNFEAGFTKAVRVVKRKQKKEKITKKVTKLPQIKMYSEDDPSLNAAVYLEQQSRTPTISRGNEKQRLE